jgi:UDP-N-acetylglucosamine--N-acetylmuramyl-(pentapeptide) pyrophosphoryl-undecaprenol N-acetylglucosamine transferase
LGFVEQMELAYAAADLMLGALRGRHGAGDAAVGLPAVFVPYPHGNGEQARNAESVVKAGGGLLLLDADCTRSGWRARSRRCMHDRRAAQGMAEALAGVAQTDAATVLATRVLEVMG